jgi:hypothetical protein
VCLGDEDAKHAIKKWRQGLVCSKWLNGNEGVTCLGVLTCGNIMDMKSIGKCLIKNT